MKDEYCCQALQQNIQEDISKKFLLHPRRDGEDCAEAYEHYDTLLSLKYNIFEHCKMDSWFISDTVTTVT